MERIFLTSDMKRTALWRLLCCIGLILSQIACESDVPPEREEDGRRPIWNIAHMVNAIYQVDYYLRKGANSVEFDVEFNSEGKAMRTFHGLPCDCFRNCYRTENFIDYIDYLSKVTTPGDENFRETLVLLFMDVKLRDLSRKAKFRAGEDIAKKLIKYYWKKGTPKARAYILISLPSINHLEFVESFRQTLSDNKYSSYYESKTGFDFSGNENLDYIRSALESVGVTHHIWQGDGITNCLPRGTRRLWEALRRRDLPSYKYIEKVYWWTVDRMSTMKRTLRMGVDGIITNHPHRLIRVLEDDEFSSKLRLATIDDSPWQKYSLRSSADISDVRPANNGNYSTEVEGEELLYNS